MLISLLRNKFKCHSVSTPQRTNVVIYIMCCGHSLETRWTSLSCVSEKENEDTPNCFITMSAVGLHNCYLHNKICIIEIAFGLCQCTLIPHESVCVCV